MRSYYLLDDAISLVSAVLAAVCLIGLMSWAIVGLSTPGEIADIESLRADVAVADPRESEDVIGQAVAANRDIARARAYNRMWWSGWIVPDAWETVDPIAIPQR